MLPNLLSTPQTGQGGKLSKRLGGNIGCNKKTSTWHLIGFPDFSNIVNSQYNVGEKHTVMYVSVCVCV